MWRVRRWRRCGIVAVTLLLLVTYIVTSKLYTWNIICHDHTIQQKLQHICSVVDVSSSTVCAAVCGVEEAVISCVPQHASKHVAVWTNHNTRMVLKSSQEKPDNIFTQNESNMTEEFHSMLRSTLWLNFKINATGSLKLPPSAAALNALWTLYQDREYIFSTLLSKLHVFPRVLGACSTWYAEEYLQQLTYKHVLLEATRQSKIKYALNILTLLDTLNSQSLLLCDVKLEHFGYSSDGGLRFLDVDSVYFETHLSEMISGMNCSCDGDCGMFDCLSSCDVESGRCNSKVSTSNLSVVCRKLLSPLTGLLYSVTDPQVQEVLTQCSLLNNHNQERTLIQKLSTLLQGIS